MHGACVCVCVLPASQCLDAGVGRVVKQQLVQQPDATLGLHQAAVFVG